MKNKLLNTLISIPTSILGYLIYYTICKIAVLASVWLAILSLYFYDDDTYINECAMVFVWIVLIVESYCMIMILYRFHNVTKGMTVGYAEGCLLLWICGVVGHTIINRQELKLSSILLLESDIGIAKDIRMLSFCLIAFLLSSLLYKIGQNKKIKGIGWKINKGIFLFFLICLSIIMLVGVAFIIWFISNWQPING